VNRGAVTGRYSPSIRLHQKTFIFRSENAHIPADHVITRMKPKFIKERMVVNGKVYFPRKNAVEGLATYASPEEIDPNALPVGRISVDTVGFGELLRDLISEMRSVGAAYPLEYLEAMQNLSLVNPDVAQMIDNIVQLGNTGHKVMVESDSEQVRDDAIEELNRFNMTVFGRFGGIDGFVNSALAQIGRGGAISVEWVVNEDLTGIDKMVFVPLKEIRFLYDPDSGEYAPHQKTCDLTKGDQGLIALNTATYQYCAMQTLDNSPYAVPPILSALESITIQRDIVKNLRFIAKKMGLLGFVNFLIRAPKQSPGEKTEEYIARCQQFLDQQAQRLKHNYRDGIAVGFMDSFTVEHHSITGDAAGAKDLFEMNEQQVFSGLKADPALHGRTYSTTETYAGVVYEKMLSIITNYQRTVRSVLEYGYKLHLSLRGIDYQSLWIEFEPSKSLSAQRDETTYATRLANLKILYDQGIIDQNQFAQEAGYDRPAEEGPRNPLIIPPADTGESAQSKTVFELIFDKPSGSYRVPERRRYIASDVDDDESSAIDMQVIYKRCIEELDKHFPSCCPRKESFELNHAQEQVDRFQREYFAAVYPVLRKSRNKTLKQVKAFFDDFDFETGDSDLFANGVLETMGLFFAQSLENSVLEKRTSSNIALIYSYFRLEDAEPFGGTIPIKPSFNLIDKKAINFLKNSDDFYFGRYLTNPQTKKDLKNWLVDEYLKSGRNLRDSGELTKFKNRFGDRVAQEDYKILRVVETSTNRSRNWGNIFLAEQAKAASIEITGPLDNVTCPWCQSMTGKKFRVDPVVQHVRDVLDQDPDNLPTLNPFLPGRIHPAVVDALDENQLLSQGIALPPYHPHCRHGYVVDRFR